MPMYIDFPEVVIDEDSLEETVFNLYSSLGWNGKTEIDATSVVINTRQSLEICQLFIDSFGTQGGLVYMNIGPSHDESVPYGKAQVSKRY